MRLIHWVLSHLDTLLGLIAERFAKKSRSRSISGPRLRFGLVSDTTNAMC
jgi:hypothetical protein